MEINKSVVARVSDLPKMELQEVKDLWLELYKEPPPRSPRSFLVKKLAYRLQELAYGISPDTEVRVRADGLDSLVRELGRHTQNDCAPVRVANEMIR